MQSWVIDRQQLYRFCDWIKTQLFGGQWVVLPFGTAPAARIIRHLAGRCGRIDAIGCQQAIVKQIVDQKGQYLIGLKANGSGQPSGHAL